MLHLMSLHDLYASRWCALNCNSWPLSTKRCCKLRWQIFFVLRGKTIVCLLLLFRVMRMKKKRGGGGVWSSSPVFILTNWEDSYSSECLKMSPLPYLWEVLCICSFHLENSLFNSFLPPFVLLLFTSPAFLLLFLNSASFIFVSSFCSFIFPSWAFKVL